MRVTTLFLFLLLPTTGRTAPAATTAAAPVDPYKDAMARVKSDDPMQRRKAAEDLANLRRPEAAPELMPLLSDANAFVRAAGADAVGILRFRPAIPKLSELLLKDKEAGVRQSAATALAYLGDPSAAGALGQALSDKEPSVRYAAARTLGVMRAPQAIPALTKALADPDPSMRRTAAAALGSMNDRSVEPALEKLVGDADPLVRADAVRALGVLGDPAAVGGLTKALNDPSIPLRLQAAQALARLGSTAGAEAAYAALGDKDSQLRQQAAAVIGMVGDEKKGLATLNKAFAGEKDLNTQRVLDFARTQLKARLGIKADAASSSEVAAVKPAAEKTPAKPAAKPGAKPSAKAGAKPKPAAPRKP